MPLTTVNVHLLPPLAPVAMDESCAIVIDVLRATTSMVHALANGASAIFPCVTIEHARQRGAELGHPASCLLAGERQGLAIAGFDLGNSPQRFLTSTVQHRPIVFTSTNGTLAIERCSTARNILLAAFTNYRSVARLARSYDRVDIVCAGTNGEVTREDTLLAGLLVTELTGPERAIDCNDSASIAIDSWLRVGKFSADVLADTQGGRNLLAIERLDDIEFCAQLDICQVVPTRGDEGCFLTG